MPPFGGSPVMLGLTVVRSRETSGPSSARKRERNFWMAPRCEPLAKPISSAYPPAEAGLLPHAACPGEFGAGEGIRTLDPNLGKVVLYP
jgi:hypothetical protein